MVKLVVGKAVKGKYLQGISKPDSSMKVFCDLLGLTEENFIAAKSSMQATIIRISWLQDFFGKKVEKDMKKMVEKGKGKIYAHFPKLPYAPEPGLRKSQEYCTKWRPKKNVNIHHEMLQEIHQALADYSVDDERECDALRMKVNNLNSALQSRKELEKGNVATNKLKEKVCCITDPGIGARCNSMVKDRNGEEIKE
ncbi:hypothetical protein GIB67_025593 [Kingdonia uniflora]|uniref:Uncharacterized protein n=1 Tax=Kingdonia uniflora TaxID=39325 RepID=A0A7J7M0P6_9MAGN|nr:hypothetical protein GIB67_025593 [Kingdonia uniflora]